MAQGYFLLAANDAEHKPGDGHDHGDGHGHDHGHDHGGHGHGSHAEADGHGGDHHGGMSIDEVNSGIAVLMWITFIFVLLVLHRLAWKPILALLDQRETKIREAVEKADKIQQDLSEIEGKRAALIAEADEKAKEIVAAAREAAKEAAHAIEQKARSEAQILTENAQREIKAAEEKAAANLRKESAELAVALAGRLLSENLDTEKNRQLIDGLINEV
jgi:F-type H+-transporting ATPase subunit b